MLVYHVLHVFEPSPEVMSEAHDSGRFRLSMAYVRNWTLSSNDCASGSLAHASRNPTIAQLPPIALSRNTAPRERILRSVLSSDGHLGPRCDVCASDGSLLLVHYCLVLSEFRHLNECFAAVILQTAVRRCMQIVNMRRAS